MCFNGAGFLEEKSHNDPAAAIRSEKGMDPNFGPIRKTKRAIIWEGFRGSYVLRRPLVFQLTFKWQNSGHRRKLGNGLCAQIKIKDLGSIILKGENRYCRIIAVFATSTISATVTVLFISRIYEDIMWVALSIWHYNCTFRAVLPNMCSWWIPDVTQP